MHGYGQATRTFPESVQPKYLYGLDTVISIKPVYSLLLLELCRSQSGEQHNYMQYLIEAHHTMRSADVVGMIEAMHIYIGLQSALRLPRWVAINRNLIISSGRQ